MNKELSGVLSPSHAWYQLLLTTTQWAMGQQWLSHTLALRVLLSYGTPCCFLPSRAKPGKINGKEGRNIPYRRIPINVRRWNEWDRKSPRVQHSVTATDNSHRSGLKPAGTASQTKGVSVQPPTSPPKYLLITLLFLTNVQKF